MIINIPKNYLQFLSMIIDTPRVPAKVPSVFGQDYRVSMDYLMHRPPVLTPNLSSQFNLTKTLRNNGFIFYEHIRFRAVSKQETRNRKLKTGHYRKAIRVGIFRSNKIKMEILLRVDNKRGFILLAINNFQNRENAENPCELLKK